MVTIGVDMNKIFKAINMINEDYCNRRCIDWKPVTNPSDPDYDTKPDEEREARVSEEVERLMSNPIELLEVDIEEITKMVWVYGIDNDLSCAESWLKVMDYYREVAEAQAERSEEHTSELQSPDHLVCRLLLEKKKNKKHTYNNKDKMHPHN